MAKLLIQSRASEKDPEYSKIVLKSNGTDVPFHDFFLKDGIRTLKEDNVISCHGNTHLDLDIANDVNRLFEKKHKIVSMQSGGLYFAKPSIEAANMPQIPVISIPLDFVSFLAPWLPSGTAAIGGVGIQNYQCAANVAKAILLNEFEGVHTYQASDKLLSKLEELHVPNLGELSKLSDHEIEEKRGLVIGCIYSNAQYYYNRFDSLGKVGILSVTLQEYPDILSHLSDNLRTMNNSVYVRGDENAAYFAAKVLASYKKDVRETLEWAATKKADSYDHKGIALADFRR